MKYAIITLLFIFFSCDSSSQNQKMSLDSCNCELVFKDLIEKLENNYIALAQKRLANDDKAYEEWKINFAEKSVKINAEECTAFLNDFLSIFEDGHLSVFEYPNHSEVELSEFKQDIKKNKLTSVMLESMISNDTQTINSNEDKILGNWTDGKSDFLVAKDKNVYKAYIIKSTIEGIEFGECKAIFKSNSDGYNVSYYSYNYSKRYIRGNVHKEGTFFRAGNVFWTKKTSPFKRELESIDKTDFKLPSIVKIDKKNTVVSLPSFLVDAKSFNTFLDKNEQIIKNSENLIIDIRGNTGGNGIYFPLIEMYATQNMEGSQGLVLASQDNLSYFEQQQKYSSKVFKPVVNRIINNQGKIVDGPLYPEKKFKIRKSKIKNVAIITDKSCASAAESFILHSKRSSTKVKTFGKSTHGMIDYTSVSSILLNSGKQYIYFGYPTSTLNKETPNNGYNKTGIVPDVSIQEDVKDKVDFVIKHYQNQGSESKS